MTVQRKSYTAGHFELLIDGHATSAYLKSVEGGFVKANPVDEPIGPENVRIKHTSTVEIDQIALELGLSGAKDVLLWIQSSWRKQTSRRNGQINHANFDLYKTFEHEFYDALIAETQFPTLDGASKDPGYLKMKILPERVVTRTLDTGDEQKGSQIDGRRMPAKQKLWVPSAFRLSIDGLDEMQYCNKIEGFTIKQGIKKFYTGADRFPQIEPTKIEFPNILGTIGAGHATKLHEWYENSVVKGQKAPATQKSGSIEFLGPDHQAIFRINLFEVGLVSLKIEPSTANSDQIKRTKFELYVGRMDLDGDAALGLD